MLPCYRSIIRTGLLIALVSSPLPPGSLSVSGTGQILSILLAGDEDGIRTAHRDELNQTLSSSCSVSAALGG